MRITRRAGLIGAAAAFAQPARAQDAPFQAAARYSAAHRGVSMLVMQGDRILFEDYPNEGAPDQAWELASGTKSFTGVMAAAAVQDRLLHLDEPCADTLTEWRGDARKRRVTIRLLLSLCSGLDPGGILRPPAYADAINEPAQFDPGSHFAYGPAPFQTFGEIMRRKLAAARRDPDPVAYLHARVLDPEGIAVGQWRTGGDGNPLMPQGAALTARNWAKFGRLVMTGGHERVDLRALEDNFRPSPANPGYGMSWWLLRPGLIGPARGMPIDAPADLAARYDIRMAAGAGDQRLYLIPPRDMIIVRQASGILAALMRRERDYLDAEFLRLALEG